MALWHCDIRQVAAGSAHALALTQDGATLFAWGSAAFGQTGLGQDAGRFVPIPTQVAFTDSCTFEAIAAGGQHSIAKTLQGGIYTWGDNSYGQAGFAVEIADRIHRPRLLELRVRGVSDPLKLIQAVGGSTVTLFLVHRPNVNCDELDREIVAAGHEAMEVELQDEEDVEVEPSANPSDNRPFPAGFGYVAWHCGYCRHTYGSGESTLQCDNPDCRKQGRWRCPRCKTSQFSEPAELCQQCMRLASGGTLTSPPPPESNPPQVASIERGISTAGFTFQAFEPASTELGTADGTSPTIFSGATGTFNFSSAFASKTRGLDAPAEDLGWTFPANESMPSTPRLSQGTSTTAIGSSVHVPDGSATSAIAFAANGPFTFSVGTSTGTGQTTGVNEAPSGTTGFVFRSQEQVAATPRTATRGIGSGFHSERNTASTTISRSHMGTFQTSRLSTPSRPRFTSSNIASLNARGLCSLCSDTSIAVPKESSADLSPQLLQTSTAALESWATSQQLSSANAEGCAIGSPTDVPMDESFVRQAEHPLHDANGDSATSDAEASPASIKKSKARAKESSRGRSTGGRPTSGAYLGRRSQDSRATSASPERRDASTPKPAERQTYKKKRKCFK